MEAKSIWDPLVQILEKPSVADLRLRQFGCYNFAILNGQANEKHKCVTASQKQITEVQQAAQTAIYRTAPGGSEDSFRINSKSSSATCSQVRPPQ